MTNIINRISIFAILMCWVFLSLIVYWGYFDRSLPVTLNLEQVSPYPTTVTAGDSVTITYSITKMRSCFFRTERILENIGPQSSTYVVSTADRSMTDQDVGKQYDSVYSFKVGLDVVSGEYDFYKKLSFECNPMQRYFPIVITSPKARIIVITSPKARIKII